MMLHKPMVASVQPPAVADRPRSTKYAGRCTVMNASWNPQVKKPNTSMTYERCAKASESACRSDCGGAVSLPGEPSLFGAARTVDNGSTASMLTAKIMSVCCQPYWSMSITNSGEYRNCPNDAAAVPKPKPIERHSGGSSLPNVATIIMNEVPDRPKPISAPAEMSSTGALAACDISPSPRANISPPAQNTRTGPKR